MSIEIKVTDLFCKICNKNTFKNHRGLSQHIYQKHHINVKDYYDIYYKRFDEGYCHNENCNNQTYFLNLTNGYRKYCCRKCADLDKNKHEKYKQTCLNKFGKTSSLAVKEIHDKGVKASQSEKVKEKRNTTNLRKYGHINPFGSTEIIKKITKTKSKTGSRSSIEIAFENELATRNIKYTTDYNSDDYPFHCDFYLIDTNTYIEINVFWFHNNHYFDINNENDLKTLEIWKEKAKTSHQYQKAIQIWTKSDIEKRNYAIKNNLNYIVLWNKDDIKNFFLNM